MHFCPAATLAHYTAAGTGIRRPDGDQDGQKAGPSMLHAMVGRELKSRKGAGSTAFQMAEEAEAPTTPEKRPQSDQPGTPQVLETIVILRTRC